MNMRIFISPLLSLLLLASFKPGEPVATLTCKSASGRTTFTATLPSCSYLEKAELSIDGSKLSFTSADQGKIIFDPDNQVLTVYLETESSASKDQKFLQFWALPSSFKKIKSDKGPGSQFHDIYEFKAKLYATEPRQVKDFNTKVIELSCTLDYQL